MKAMRCFLFFLLCLMIHLFEFANAGIFKSKQKEKVNKEVAKCGDDIDRAIVGHHKLGSHLAMKFHNALLVTTGCDVKVLQGWVPQSMDKTRIVNLVQNPFDYLISTYMHHKRGAEPWSKCPMKADPECEVKFLKNRIWKKNLETVHKLYSYIELFQNVTNAQGIILTVPDSKQSYAEYLRAIALDKGLVCTYLFDKFNKGLSEMKRITDQCEGNDKRVSLCADQMDVQNLTWTNQDVIDVHASLGLKPSPLLNVGMAKNRFIDHKKVASYVPMLKAIRTWDVMKNHGELTILEQSIGCVVHNEPLYGKADEIFAKSKASYKESAALLKKGNKN